MSAMTLRVPSAALLVFLSLAAHSQQQVLPLWPHGTPEPAQTTAPETDVTKNSDALISGHRSARLTNVTNPTLTVYPPPADKNTGVAALVFPGGGYVRLAWNGEGTDTCEWLNSVGITCLLVKYRVPEKEHYPDNPSDLEDAQQAMRLARAHAGEWHIDPAKIGVVGFSAGANLAVLLSTHPDDHHVESTPAKADIPGITSETAGSIKLTGVTDARPSFAIVVYPAYLGIPPDITTLDPAYTPNKFTPPTFLIQAENDKTYGKNAPLYYQALAAAGVPAELHMFATGGHGFGIHPADTPEEHWTRLANVWLRDIGILPHPAGQHPEQHPNQSTGTPNPIPTNLPCPTPTPAQQPSPSQPNRNPNTSSAYNPCL